MSVAGRIIAPLALAVLLLSGHATGATPSGTTGQSWTDPPLGEILRTADVVAEVKVFIGGQFTAYVDVIRTFKGTAPKAIRLEGFNSYEWNTAYYSMRENESYVMALYRAGDVYCPATPAAGRFPLDNNRVIGRFGAGEFLVEIPGDDFREALGAFYRADPNASAAALGRLLQTGSIETSYFATVLLGELASIDAAAANEAVKSLTRIARHENAALREAAASALGRIGGGRAVKALATFVADADWSVSITSARAACRADAAGAGRELVAWLERAAVRDLKRRRRADNDSLKAQGEVFQFLATGDWLRGASADERTAVVHGMMEIVASAEPARARVAARVLGRMGAIESIPSLALMLDAEDTQLREEAAGALTAITLTPEAFSKLRFDAWWRRHRDKPRHRWVAAGLRLARSSLDQNTYEGDSLGRALLAIAGDPASPWIVRRKLATGSGWSGLPVDQLDGPLIAPFVEIQLTSQSGSSRTEALASVARMQKQFPLSRQAYLPSLLALSCDADSDVRVAVFEALEGGRDGAIAERAMHELVRGTDSASRNAAAAVLRSLTGKHFGFHISRGYELPEEGRGLDRWKSWWADAARAGWKPAARATRATPAVALRPTEALLKLTSDNPDHWLAAAAHLARETQSAASSLTSAARSPEGRTRAIAASVIGLRAEESLGTAAAGLLDDDEPMVRLQAAWATGCCLAGTGSAPERLFELARQNIPSTDEADPEPEADPDLPPSMTELDPFERQRPTARALSAVQSQALIALGKIGGTRAVQVLETSALSENGDIAACAAYALSLATGDRADAALRRVLVETGSTSTRDIVARGLASRPSRESVKALITVASRLDRWYSYPLVNALGRMVSASDAAVLASFLDPENESAAVAGTYALSKAPGASAVPSLITVLDKSTSTPRYYAAKALSKLAEEGRLPAALRAACSEALALRIDDFDATVASASGAALEYAGDASAGDALMKYLELFQPPDFRAFGAAARLAGGVGHAFVSGQLGTETWGSKYFALRAMRYVPAPHAIAALMKQWRDPESPFQEIAALSLVASGPRAVAALDNVLRMGTSAEKRRAAILLAHFLTPGANMHLQRATASTDRDLARAAEMALQLRGSLSARGGRRNTPRR